MGSASTEVVEVIDPASVTTDLATLVANAGTATVTDPVQIQAEIINRILEAGDVDSVFALAGTTPAMQVLGVPLMVNASRVMKSGFEEGLDIYSVIDAIRLDTGEQVTVTCGAGNVIAMLERLRQLGAFPVACSIEQQTKQTANGFRVMYLKDQREFAASLTAGRARVA